MEIACLKEDMESGMNADLNTRSVPFVRRKCNV